ncbi:DNA cytosine methyltransferase [Flavobacterium sp. P4023]|uniref:DNA (cytosine-5-)-methyltransferase n=1 Tax=Flavobacterium flabelliforme TaxID=2816119 RepID=A0ABS5CT12_9FLAO|nr:DNA (cytosine-5-)-methyltransferase [Flavobacterium flabelliforme]MBP4141766.1 DNA cytosine methyltransferase [Flavobacterium flabelliforme]
MNNLTVIDFFCGAGGFSEGFKQMGFEIKHGYDHWKPAIDTYNHNFNLECQVKNILDFKKSIEEIENLPDTDIIIGSPPCVSFSSSNKSGNADKSLGVELTETFLRIVAVKKHQPNSILKAWFMENVVNSKRYLQTQYTFKDLGLTEWANKYRISPLKIAIDLFENTSVINSADYGSIQSRKRVISGEIIKKKKLIIPQPTHQQKDSQLNLPLYNSISLIKRNFPSPFEKKSKVLIKDIQYPIELEQDKITDHFYDTGVYEAEWRFSKHWKTNHPFMGKMSFPENVNNPSRTITATKIANSRESIIYKSEINRTGDGEYRLPTVREASIIMGFPITYQFVGSENAKWRLVGNAVCASVSRAFASTVLSTLGIKQELKLITDGIPNLKGVLNLNNYSRKTFDNPPIKNKNARCRWQPVKEGNLTVTLSNYNIEKNNKPDGKWRTSIQYGTGKGFPIQHIEDEYFKKLESIVLKFKGGAKFLELINNGFSEKIGSANKLQEMFELQKSIGDFLEPTRLVDEVGNIIQKTIIDEPNFVQIDTTIFLKKMVPTKQLFALYAINKIATIANSN